MTKRITSIVLSFTLVLSMFASWSSFTTLAATTENSNVSAVSSTEVVGTDSQNNIVARADALYKCTWTAAKTVNGWRDQYTFTKGKTYHLPYGQPATAGKYIGFNVSFSDFLTATLDSTSDFYTKRSNYSSKYSTYYATDCSAFVSYCWGVSRNTTSSLGNVASKNLGKATTTNVQKLQLGDALNYSGSHVVLVTGLTKSSSGDITKVEITEQTPPELKRTTYTAASLASKYSSNYSILRYSGTVSAPTYTFTFDANGGTGTMSDKKMTWGTSANIPANKFTKDGYTFKGWYAKRNPIKEWRYTNGTDTGWYTTSDVPSGYSKYLYKDKASVSATGLGVSDTVTLKAVWEKDDTPKTFTFTFDANGGTGTMANQTITYGTDTAISANKFTKDGYTFKGWYAYRADTKEWRYKNYDGETGWYAKGSQPAGYFRYKYSDQAVVAKTGLGTGDTVKLTAVWGTVDYSVAYDANGGSGTMENSSHTNGVEKTLRLNTFTKSKHTLGGWTLSKKSDGKWLYTQDNGSSNSWYLPGSQPDGYRLSVYEDGRTVSKLSGVAGDVVTCHAHWIPKTTGTTTFYIDYNANGGSGSMSRTTVIKGTDTTLPKCSFTRPGYKFAGWRAYRPADNTWRMTNTAGEKMWTTYTERPSGYDTFTLYKDGGTVASTSSVDCEVVTFYAEWTEDFKFTVGYNANGGTGTMANQTVKYGTATALSANKFTRDGYAFKGWNVYQNTTGKWLYTNGSANAFYANGAQPSGYSLAVFTDQQSISTTGSPYDDVLTMYAVWEFIPVFTFVFDANGGTGTMANQKIEYGVATNISANAFTREGYEFKGWNVYREASQTWKYQNDEGTKGWYAEGQQPEGYYLSVYKDKASVSKTGLGTGDTVKLRAVWEFIPVFTFVFDANGGDGTMANQKVNYGVATNISANAFTKEGYEFKGWNVFREADNTWRYVNADGDAGWYAEGQQPEGYELSVYEDQKSISKTGLGTGDTVKLTAVWEKLPIIGDVDGDGVLTIEDATEIQKALAKISDLSAEQLALCDVNGDGWVDVKDATAIQLMLLK